jgi:hypothetical protein
MQPALARAGCFFIMTVISNKATYEQYFTELLAAHVDITATVIGIDQFTNAHQGWTHGQWYAIIGEYEARISGHTADNYTPLKTGSVTIIKKPGDAPIADRPTIESAAEAICQDVMSRMWRDQRTEGRPITFRDCRIYFIEQALAAGYMGCRMEIDFTHGISMAYDASKWTDS